MLHKNLNGCIKFVISPQNKSKMLMEAHNSWGHCTDIKELEEQCPLEIMQVSKIISFMFIIGKTKGAQHELKGQCVVVPTDLQKDTNLTG